MKTIKLYQYFLILSLILFFIYIGWSAYNKDKSEWVAFPIYKGYESCIFKLQESWMKDENFTIEPFFMTPDSMPGVYGYVRVRIIDNSRSDTKAHIAGIFHQCYPNEFSIFKISAQQDISILNSLGLLLNDYPQDAKKIHIEISLETNELKASFK